MMKDKPPNIFWYESLAVKILAGPVQHEDPDQLAVDARRVRHSGHGADDERLGLDGDTFCAYVEQMLAPTLAPGDIVIMDNLASHKVRGVREAIAATGAELVYPPPYIPDLNPIENLFAKIKTFLRKRAERNVEALWHTIGDAIQTITPSDCANCFRHAGYT